MTKCKKEKNSGFCGFLVILSPYGRVDLDVARLGAPEADEAGDDDDHNVDDSQADVHGEQALPQNDQEQRQRNTADGVVQAIGHMVARLLPGIGIFFGAS